jgi:hypothetical protein
MKIKHLTTYAGPDGGFLPGVVRDVPDELGQALIAGHYAEAVKPEAVREVAAVEPREERAAEVEKPAVRRRRRG